MKHLYLFLLLPFLAVAQEHKCRTVTPSEAEQIKGEQRLKTLAQIRKNSLTTNSGMTCVPIHVHDIRTSSGTGAISKLALSRGIANLNHYFGPAGIEFYICGLTTYDSDTYYDFDPDTDLGGGTTEEDNLKSVKPPVTNAFNMYLVNSFPGNTAGFAYYPIGDDISNTTSFIDKSWFDTYPSGTLVHEFGHHFFLYHTHNGTSNGNTHPNAETVARSGVNSNCTGKGDYLCDTHADPAAAYDSIVNCAYIGAKKDIHGVIYTPPTGNIMSYYDDDCGQPFTPGQIERIQDALSERQSHTSYSLDCTPASVNAPINLAGVQNSSSVDLTWADQANNELGYIVERSEISASTGFLTVKAGGTSDNATAFSDFTVSPKTTYYYRVKAINGDCNTYSNVATVVVGLVYCTPNYGSQCSGAVITNFTLTGNTTINNTSTCTGDSYFDYSQTISSNVTAGSTYNASITKGATNARYVQIFGDFNRDGDFDDLGEKLLADNTVATHPTHSTNITIPASAYNGSSRLRVVLKNQVTIVNSCESMNFGETEDYAVYVSGGVISGINKLESTEHALALIPNPSSGKTQLNVWSEEASAGYVCIRSVEGTVLQRLETTFNYGDNSLELDVSALPSGAYIVESGVGANIRMTRLFKY